MEVAHKHKELNERLQEVYRLREKFNEALLSVEQSQQRRYKGHHY